MRWLLALALLLLSAPAHAFLPHGGGSSCFPSGSQSPAGTTITPANTGCVIKDGAGKTWQFQPSSSYDANGNWPLLVNGVASTSGTKAEIGADGIVYESGYAGNCTGATPYSLISPSPTPGIFSSVSPPLWQQPSFATGVPALATGYYRVTHGGVTTNYNTALASIAAALTNDTMHWLANPTGLDKWQQGTTPLSVAGLTVNIDAGYVEGCQSGANPGFFQINAANIAINGGGNGYANGASLLYGSNIVIQPNASSPTINGIHYKYGQATTGILSGNLNQGFVTIENSTLEKVNSYNAASGNYHLIYLGDSIVGDPAASALIQGNYLMDVLGGGWPLKLRPLGITTQGHVTQNYMGCLDAGTVGIWTGCEQNGDIDMPCGGNYLIDYNSLEYGAHADNWFMIRGLEEGGGQACPTRVDIIGNWVNGTTINSAFGIDPNGVTGDPRLHGAAVGDTFGATTGYCPGAGIPCDTTIVSFSGTSPNMTIVVTCSATPNCIPNPGTSGYRWAKEGAAHVVADETGCANTSTICNLKDSLGNAITPANAYIFNTYLVSGSGIQSGSSVASTTSASITLTCGSPPCTDGSSTGVTVQFVPPFNVTVDHNVLVWDIAGLPSGNHWPPIVATTGCGNGQYPQTLCQLPAGGKVTFTNNDIVGLQHDSSCDPGIVTGLGLIASGATDANGNTCYASRLAYATAKGLLNTTDFAGNTCTSANSCAAPFTFPHPP